MNPIFQIGYQMLQAFGLLTLFQNGIAAIIGLVVIGVALNVFWKRQ